MWNGQIVPIIDGHLPLPRAVRTGIGIDDGTRLLVSAFILPQIQGKRRTPRLPDVYGGLLFSIARSQVLDRVTKFVFSLPNEIGEIHKIVSIIARHNGQIVQMEGLAPGHFTCEVYFQKSVSLLDCAEALRRAVHLSGRPDEIHRQQLFVVPPPIASGKEKDGRDSLRRELRRRGFRHSEIVPRLDYLHKVIEASHALNRPSQQGDSSTLREEVTGLGGAFGAVAQVLVSPQGIPIPFSLIDIIDSHAAREYGVPQSLVRRPTSEHGRPKYVLLASDPEELAITCYIPTRPLVELRVRSRSVKCDTFRQVGIGTLVSITDVLKSMDFNIVHTRLTNLHSRYDHIRQGGEDDGDVIPFSEGISEKVSQDYDAFAAEPSFEEGQISIVASVPPHWSRTRNPERLSTEFKVLEERIRARVGGPWQSLVGSDPWYDDVKRKILSDGWLDRVLAYLREFLNGGPQDAQAVLHEGLLGAAEELEGLDDERFEALARRNPERILRFLSRYVMAWSSLRKAAPEDLQASATQLFNADTCATFAAIAVRSESPKILSVEVLAPPVLRCFVAASDSPSDREAAFLKLLVDKLDKLALRVVEGRWHLGKAIDQATRGEIETCNIFVAVMWPRKSAVRDESGSERCSDWIIHEESHAMALKKSVFRVREERISNPAYRADYREYLVREDDEATWKAAVEDLGKQVQRVITRQAYSDDRGRVGDRDPMDLEYAPESEGRSSHGPSGEGTGRLGRDARSSDRPG